MKEMGVVEDMILKVPHQIQFVLDREHPEPCEMRSNRNDLSKWRCADRDKVVCRGI